MQIRVKDITYGEIHTHSHLNPLKLDLKNKVNLTQYIFFMNAKGVLKVISEIRVSKSKIHQRTGTIFAGLGASNSEERAKEIYLMIHPFNY